MNIYDKIDKKELPVATVSIYKKIYNIFFNYCFLGLSFLLALIIFIGLSQNTITLNRVDKYPTERLRLLKDINKETSEFNDKDISTKIIQGNISHENGTLESSNNLLSYKGFIMPRNFKIYDNNLIKPKTYFTGGYNTDDLQYFIETVIFGDSINNGISDQLPLLELTDNSIENTFFVSCLDTNPNGLCKQFIGNFTETFYVYDLTKDYPGLNSIFNKIKSTDYKDDFCEGITKYISYTKDTSADIEGIMSQCGGDFYTDFTSKKSFYTIQQQLNNGFIKSTISSDIDVNAYKLISYQQILYNNVKNGVINEANFTTYLNFISSLLKKQNSIDNIYYDITYRINNVYLIPTLNTRKYKLTENKRSELDEIINNIYAINQGSKVQGHLGLESKLINKKLTQLTEYTSSGYISEHEQNEIYQLLNNIKGLSYIKVIDEAINNKSININGYMIIPSISDWIYFGANFINKDGKLILTKIGITNYEELNNTINSLLKNHDYTIIDIYEYIKKSINLYSSNDFISTCDIIKSNIEKNNNTLTQCSPEKILIKKENGTTYNFSMKHYSISSVIVSDKRLEENINKLISKIYTNDSTIPTIINEILAYEIQESIETNNDMSLNAINTIRLIKEYLGTEITDIIENPNETVYIKFSLSNINFEGLFNTKTNLLYSLSFSDKNIQINDFKITLDTNNSKEINKFKNDTLQYINSFDQNAVNEYKSNEETKK